MKNATIETYQERVLRALQYIQGHLDESLALDELARAACFSPFHFHRVFRAMAGEPLQEHIRRLRLERAAQRLKLQDRPVTEIAFEAGYDSHEAFTRAFHAMFGMPPLEFRAAQCKPGNHAAPDSPSGTHYEDTSGYRPPDYGGPPAVELRTQRPENVVFLRHAGPYSEVGATWGKLAAWAGPRGLFGSATRFIGVSYDDPEITPLDKLRYDAAITVSVPVQPSGEIGTGELAGGDYAVLVHKGPYEGLGAAYRALFGGWLPHTRRELRDAPCLEYYLNSPQTTRPEDLLTAIHVPLA